MADGPVPPQGAAPVDGAPVDRAWTALSPAAFLRRSRAVFGDCLAVTDGDLRLTYAQLWDRSTRLAGAVRGLGIAPSDRVAMLARNGHELLEAHFGLPLASAVLVALNVRLAPAELGWILRHCGARLLLVDPGLAGQGAEAARIAGTGIAVVGLGDPDGGYERLIATGPPLDDPLGDELGTLSIKYTSGTTGEPKGVVYHPRGAYLQALAMVHHARLDHDARFLWTLPMFHCNGWCFPWAVTAAGGVHICIPKPSPELIWAAIREHGVTHFNAAPTVLIDLVEHPSAAPAPRPVEVAAGGAPPTPALLRRLEALGIHVTHLYGLTETFGPVGVCEWRSEWAHRPAAEQAVLKARQGVANIVAPALRVVDGSGADVPADGETLGEVTAAGNTIMTGYHLDPDATRRAIPDGWLRTGDLGVMHPDGYIEMRDRAKDIIISGGENISSIEVERALAEHPDVLEAAVVAVPDERWGERPVAFVTTRPGSDLTDSKLIAHARGRLAGYKVPRTIHFGPLPKTSTGKVMKFRLRESQR